ncbi:MAG: hypothetical protein IKY89_05590 [Alistipes sp.]|nr:hypothetical protein [Alistipes sp.]
MAKVLDLNNIEQMPTLELTLQDENRTTLLVTIPSEGLINELEVNGPQLTKVLRKGDKAGMDACFDLAARLISCNRNDRTITAQELREVYKMSFESLLVFYSGYMDFLEEVKSLKN